MHRLRRAVLTFATTLAAGGTCFQVGGCIPWQTVGQAIGSINPCGRFLVCDPAQYEFITSGIDGPGVRPDIDPFCTYAPFCTADLDPIFGGLAIP
jgi:hypothetical protein